MPLSLADLRNSPDVGRPETVVQLCVAGKLNARRDQIEAELHDLIQDAAQQPQPSDDPDQPQPPGRLARPRPKLLQQNPRILELNAERDALIERMRDHTIELHIVARPDGQWRTWVQDHPARDGVDGDRRAGFNLDDLIDDIGENPDRYIPDINGETYNPDDWAHVWKAAADGDQWRIAAAVRQLHQGGVDIPKSLSSLLGTGQESGTSS